MNPLQWLLFILGTISLVLGVIGIFLPLLPTTPFLLLTAYCYFRASPKAYEWLIRQKHLGPYILNYREKKIIPFRVKVYALTLMWTSVLCCMIFILENNWVKFALFLIIVGVSFHIVSFKSK